VLTRYTVNVQNTVHWSNVAWMKQPYQWTITKVLVDRVPYQSTQHQLNLISLKTRKQKMQTQTVKVSAQRNETKTKKTVTKQF